jgi:hypothetical protein
MDAILEALSRGVGQLIGRASGPFHLRLIITPTLAIIYAIRAGLRDAREGRPPFLWEIISQPAERKRLRRSWWKDIGKMIIMVLVVDTVYQILYLKAFYPVQSLILVVVLAMAPYAIVRGITTRVKRRGSESSAGGANQPDGGTTTRSGRATK